MTLKETFMEEMKKSVVTLVRSAIKQYEVDNRVELDDEGVMQIVAKEVKERKEVLPEYQKNNNTEIVEKLNAEIEYLMQYLPEQLSEEEVKNIVIETIKEIGAAGMKHMGKVMPVVMAKTKGRADGKLISQLVKENLM